MAVVGGGIGKKRWIFSCPIFFFVFFACVFFFIRSLCFLRLLCFFYIISSCLFPVFGALFFPFLFVSFLLRFFFTPNFSSTATDTTTERRRRKEERTEKKRRKARGNVRGRGRTMQETGKRKWELTQNEETFSIDVGVGPTGKFALRGFSGRRLMYSARRGPCGRPSARNGANAPHAFRPTRPSRLIFPTHCAARSSLPFVFSPLGSQQISCQRLPRKKTAKIKLHANIYLASS